MFLKQWSCLPEGGSRFHFMFGKNTAVIKDRTICLPVFSDCLKCVSVWSRDQQHQQSRLPSTWLTACLHADSPYKADAMLSGPQRGGYFYFLQTSFWNLVSTDFSKVEDAVQDFTHFANTHTQNDKNTFFNEIHTMSGSPNFTANEFKITSKWMDLISRLAFTSITVTH